MLAFVQSLISPSPNTPKSINVKQQSSDQESLSSIFESLKKIKNEKASIQVLMNSLFKRSTFFEEDLSFLGFDIISLLGSSEIASKIVGIRACCCFLNEFSPSVDMMPSALRLSFQSPELHVPALKLLSQIINPFVYHSLSNELSEIASLSSDMARIYALLAIFKAYQQNPINVINQLLPLLKRAIFQPSLKLVAISILCEVSQKDPDKCLQFTSILISELPLSSHLIFSKLLRFFSSLLSISDTNYLQSEIQNSLIQYLNQNNNVKMLIDAAYFASKLKGNSPLFLLIGSKLDSYILNSQSHNEQYVCLDAYLSLVPRCSLSVTTISAAIYSANELSVVGKALIAKYFSEQKKLQTIYDLISNVAETKSLDIAKLLINAIPKRGKICIKALFTLYQFNIDGLERYLGKTVYQISDQDTRNLFVREAVETFFEPPDDEFGFSIAFAVGDWSKDVDDIELLLPPSLGMKSTHLQAVLVSSATALWIRINYSLSKGYMNRLELLTQSNSREVRRRAQELVELISFCNL